MLRRAPALRQRLGIEQSVHAIFQPRSASSFLPLSSDAKSLDGLNVHFACLDEIGSHRTARVYDIILTALGKRLQPLLISISTATANSTGIGKQIWDLSIKVLTGALEDERFFAVLYTADEGDNPFAEATLAKANPSWGLTVVPEQVRMIARQASNNPAQEAVYKTRHLNIWVTGNQALFAMDHWAACKVEGLRLEDFAGRSCILGLDIANKIDLTALVLLFPEEDDEGKEVYSVFCRAWLPEARVESQPAYAQWISSGWLTQTPGETTDFSMIEEAILECCASFEVQAVTYDPWSATQLAQRMLERNVPMVEYPMNVSTMSEPTKAVDVCMRERRFRHDGNPVLAWCLSNVVGHRDAKDNIFPRKELPEHKIDAAIALIMALGQQIVRSAPTRRRRSIAITISCSGDSAALARRKTARATSERCVLPARPAHLSPTNCLQPRCASSGLSDARSLAVLERRSQPLMRATGELDWEDAARLAGKPVGAFYRGMRRPGDKVERPLPARLSGGRPGGR